MAGAPIREGAVLIGADGRIAAVGPAAQVPAPDTVPSEHLGRAVLLPGLINTHTHLELTGLAGRVEEDEFPAWIRRVREVKAERGPEQYLEAAREGLRRCYAAGVTTIADTGDSGVVIRALREAGGSGIAYQEVFGPDPAAAEASLAGLAATVEALRPLETERIRLGVSPHAPYTVSGPLYRMAATYARREGLPLAVHLAESSAETELVAAGRGPFAEAWRRRGIPLPQDPTHGHAEPFRQAPSPVAWLDRWDVLGPDTLCIHAVQVSEADVDLLARRRVGIAHCPRSNRRHGHGDAPLGAFRAAGLAVGVGTDSEVSVADPDLFADARLAGALAGLDPTGALGLMTVEAARALGAADLGRLAVGAWADVVAVRLEDEPRAEDLPRAILEAGPAGVVATWQGGVSVFRAPRAPDRP